MPTPAVSTSSAPTSVPPVVVAPPAPVVVASRSPEKKAAVKPPVKVESAAAPSTMAPPPVQIHKELIPKDIEIVRVYYSAMISGPASSIPFDINGSGFTKEFEKMITVESGQPDAAVKNLALVTPNQIHGTLEISAQSKTMVAFPRVLINGKVVFQAPEPFAVIRPGEVLNFVFTEMGESGRSGRFRVFTNLDQQMFSEFKVSVSTPAIQISALEPVLPFIVDGTIIIGPAVGGEYDIDVSIKGKSLWFRKGIVRVVRPNVGQSGLIQRVQASDGFQRPGDRVKFVIQGSGFQPQDVNLIQATIKGLDTISSSFTYVSPGRLDLEIMLPSNAPEKIYGLTLSAGSEVLQDLPNAFEVVPRNWPRLLRLDPPLVPGGQSMLSLVGRDLDADFISNIKIETDEPQLTIGAFKLANSQRADASISAGPDVKSGDYLLKMTSSGKPVNPEAGSLIRVNSK